MHADATSRAPAGDANHRHVMATCRSHLPAKLIQTVILVQLPHLTTEPQHRGAKKNGNIVAGKLLVGRFVCVQQQQAL